MQQQWVFIGRERELHMVEAMLFDPEGKRYVLPIFGQAGMGKTWLLQQLYLHYRADPRILVVRIDYGEPRPRSLPALSLHVIDQFGAYMSEQHVAAYHVRMDAWEMLRKADFDPDRIREEQNRIYHFGIDLIWQISQQKRTLVLSDALDTEDALEDIQRTNLLMANLPNTVMILAARPTPFAQSVYEEMETLYRRWVRQEPHELGPFSPQEVEAYFAATLTTPRPSTLRRTIIWLTPPHPVRVALGAAWLNQHDRMPPDLEGLLDAFVAQPEQPPSLDETTWSLYQARFAPTLVADLRCQRTLLDQAILVLSYLNQRYHPEILRMVLARETGETGAAIDAAIEALRSHPFVRQSLLAGGGLLHEEVRQLILEHVWPYLDPDQSKRKALARLVIEHYYFPEIKRLDSIIQEKLARSLKPPTPGIAGGIGLQERHLIPDEYWPKRDLQMDCLYYHFCLSEREGWNYLNALFDEALTHHYSLHQMDAIIKMVPRVAPQQVDTARFQVRLAQILLEKGEMERARQLAEKALEWTAIELTEAAKAMIVMAETTVDPVEKVTHFKVALEMAEAAEDTVLRLKIHNRLGLAYRRQGHWNEAEAEYLQVLRMLDEEQEPNQYAATLNNLAFVYMLNGNLIRADNLAEKALRMRREQGNIHGLGFSYATRGRIAEAMGDYVLALRYHRTAVELCELVGDTTNAALMQVNVAAAECQAQKFDTARLLLARALRSDQPHIRARALQQAARIDFEEARALASQGAPPQEVGEKYAQAEQLAQQALELARKVLDDHLTAGILVDLLLITFFKEQRKDTTRWQHLQDILKDHDYKLEKGRLMELEGNLAYAQGEIITAFEHYLNACESLAAYSFANFRQLFEQVRDKFFDAPPTIQHQVCQMIQQRFAHVSPTSPLVALKELCIDILVRPQRK